jgi:hypothetical protein
VARNYNALLVQILTAAHRPVRDLRPGVGASFAAIVDRALAKQAGDRFQSAQDFLVAVQRFKQDETPPSVIPQVGDEVSSDGDPTTVFQRQHVLIPSPKPTESGRGRIPKAYESDDESTLVDPPSFSDSITIIRRDRKSSTPRKG